MILFDTETTGLVKPYASPLKDQPRIIEFAAVKLSNKKPYKEIDSIEFLLNPDGPLPEIITKITGLTDEDLKGVDSFPAHYAELVEFFIGERYLIAHNIKFDVDLLRFDLARMDKAFEFPWPPNHICTVVNSMSVKGHRLKQEQLLQHITKEHKPGVHRAMADVRDLETIVRWMIKKELIVL